MTPDQLRELAYVLRHDPSPFRQMEAAMRCEQAADTIEQLSKQLSHFGGDPEAVAGGE